MTSLYLVKLAATSSSDDKLGFIDCRILYADTFDFPIDNPYKLRYSPPLFVAISNFVSRARQVVALLFPIFLMTGDFGAVE